MQTLSKIREETNTNIKLVTLRHTRRKTIERDKWTTNTGFGTHQAHGGLGSDFRKFIFSKVLLCYGQALLSL